VTASTDLYVTTAVSQEGKVRVVDDGHDTAELTVRAPTELGGPGGGWNAEQLYAAAVATCLHQSLVIVASTAGADTSDSAVHVRVTLGEHGAEAYDVAAVARVELPNVDDDGPRGRLVDQAARRCPLVDESQVSLA
jgi:lipoyl-dependent peroxiredoxin